MADSAALKSVAQVVSEFAGSHSDEIASGLMAFIQAAESQGRDSEVVVTLLHESTELLAERQPRGGGLTDEQARYLVESGDFTAEELAETEREVAAGLLAAHERRARLGAVTRALSASEVAALLHVDASRVRHRQAKGLLYGFLVAGRRRYPTWQFIEGQPLPNLSTVVAAFPEDWHPAGIESFMVSPKSSLTASALGETAASSESLTPVEWLASGGDPEKVVDILEGFLQS